MIHAVVREDLSQLVPLMRQYIVDFYRRPDPGDDAIHDLALHLLAHPEQGIQFVVEQEGSLVGFATLYFTFSTLQVKRAAVLNDLFVNSRYRGQKIGELLFRHCLEYVREHSYAYMQWETDKSNTVAQTLYNKMGGQISDRLVYEIL